MMRVRTGIPRWLTLALAVVPFVVLLAWYFNGSRKRLAENPNDKLMPGPVQLWKGWEDVWKLRAGKMMESEMTSRDTVESLVWRKTGTLAFIDRVQVDGADFDQTVTYEPGAKVRYPTAERRIVTDTLSSLRLLGIGLGIGIAVSLSLGLAMGSFTAVEALMMPFVSALAKIPPLALLPIIFIFLGAGDLAKITIIALGVAPSMTLDLVLRARDIPRELIIKAYTLGASTLEVVFKVILAGIWPSVLNSIRLALGPAWVFLIASEAIASEAGLGYRIFVVQRQLGMNVILIYVAWIMVLGLAMDLSLRAWISWRYPWTDVK